MALPNKGELRFSDIRAEFNSSGTNTNLSISDYYRGSTYVDLISGSARIPSSESNIRFSDFLGTRINESVLWFFDSTNYIINGMVIDYSGATAKDVLVIVADGGSTTCTNFLTKINSTGHWGTVSTSPSGVGAIGSIFEDFNNSNVKFPAIDIKNLPDESFLWIVNFGYIVGAEENGVAINIQDGAQNVNVLIDNYGTIGGGVGVGNGFDPSDGTYIGTLGGTAIATTTLSDPWVIVRDFS